MTDGGGAQKIKKSEDVIWMAPNLLICNYSSIQLLFSIVIVTVIKYNFVAVIVTVFKYFFVAVIVTVIKYNFSQVTVLVFSYNFLTLCNCLELTN